MPRNLSLKDVCAMGPGESVTQTKGTLKAVFKYCTGKGQDGNGTFQGAVLSDGPSEIKLKVWDRDDLTPLKGKQVWVISGTDSRNGKLIGLGIEEDEYQGKVSNVLVVKSKAQIVRADTPDNPQRADDGDLGPQPKTQSSPQRPSPKPPRDNWQPLGATVGMAINNACANLTARSCVLSPNDVWEMASDLIRVSRRLEQGTLAPQWSERVPPITRNEPEKETRMVGEPIQQGYEPEKDDVPF